MVENRNEFLEIVRFQQGLQIPLYPLSFLATKIINRTIVTGKEIVFNTLMRIFILIQTVVTKCAVFR